MENVTNNSSTIDEQIVNYTNSLKEIFNNYEKLDGTETPLYISALQDSIKLILTLEAERISLENANKKLAENREPTKCGECQHWNKTGHCSRSGKHKTYAGFCNEGTPKDKEQTKSPLIILRSLKRSLNKAKKELDRLNKLCEQGNLSNHGFWAIGYWQGRRSVLEDLVDDCDLEEFLDASK